MPHQHNDRIEGDWYVVENRLKHALKTNDVKEMEAASMEVNATIIEAKGKGWEVPLHIDKLVKQLAKAIQMALQVPKEEA